MNKQSRGFSLIEILIAMAILVTSIVIILPQINRKENIITKNLNQLLAINRSLYSFSKIKNRTYRLVFYLDEQYSSYWVEIKNKISDENQNLEENPPLVSEKHPLFDYLNTHPYFKLDTKILKQPHFLPSSMKFQWPDDYENPEERILIVYYNPTTFSDHNSIILKMNENQWTLNFNPLQGDLEIIDSRKEENIASQ